MSKKKETTLDIIDQSVREILNSNLLNDIFASVALEDKKTCEYVLKKITGIKDLQVAYVKGQYRLRNLTAKDTILDVFARDKAGRIINLELQRFGALSKRVRFLKSEKGGYEVMSEVAQRLRQSGIEEGEKRGEKKAKKKVAKNLFSMNTPVEDIAVALEVGVKQVKKWLGLREA